MSFDFEAELSKASDVDIWILFFPAIRKSLVIDTRSSEHDRPLVKITPMAGSTEERLKMIAKMRPQFPATEKIIFLRPPLDMAVLERSVVWSKILEKLMGAAQAEAVKECQDALAELASMEHAVKEQHTVEGAIRGGVGWGTLWERKS